MKSVFCRTFAWTLACSPLFSFFLEFSAHDFLVPDLFFSLFEQSAGMKRVHLLIFSPKIGKIMALHIAVIRLWLGFRSKEQVIHWFGWQDLRYSI